MSNLEEQEFEIENDLLINSDISISNPTDNPFSKNLKRGRDKIKNWTFKSKGGNVNYNMKSSDITNPLNTEGYSVNYTDSTGKIN